MIEHRTSVITRIFDELVRTSRRSGKVRRAPLKGGAELVVLVLDGWITLTIKRPGKRVGTTELETFRRHCGVPADAQRLTPLEQATRQVRVETYDEEFGTSFAMQTVYYVTYRWKEAA